MEESKNKSNAVRWGIIIFILILLSIIGYLLFDFYQKKTVEEVNEMSLKEIKNLDECKFIFNFDFKKYSKNKYFLKKPFNESINYCKNSYDLESLVLNKDNCNYFLSRTNDFFENNYTFTDNLLEKRKICAGKYFKPSFEVSSYFNVYNNFKTRLVLSDIGGFYQSIFYVSPGNENYEKYQKEAKDFLRNIIKIPDNEKIKDEDISFYAGKIFIDLDLKPNKEYMVSLLSDKNGKDINFADSYGFKTPENKHFGFRVINPVTLYTSKNLPKFEILDFDSGQMSTRVKICPLLEEDYAQFEILRDDEPKNSLKEYYLNEKLEKYSENCEIKDLDISKKEKNSLNKYSFDFNEYLNDKKGLFFVSFVDKDNFEFNGKINYPIFFAKTDSNILMKISKDGEGFFFVNDITTGKPLANQTISIYFNDFVDAKQKYDREGKRSIIFNYPIEGKVLSKENIIGYTDENGILKVDFKEKLGEDSYIFSKTFDTGGGVFDKYGPFFVKSQGENHVSYLTSSWNGGIEPWNFGYSSWYGNEKFSIGYEELDGYNGHIYTDRVLYLPGEEVNLRGVLRNKRDLSIPSQEDIFNLVITNSDGKFLEKEIKLNEFGSFTEKVSLPKDIETGNYNISIESKDIPVAYSGFTVETFQKPKVKTDLSLETEGLDGDFVNITKTENSGYGFGSKEYFGKFSIKGNVSSKYNAGTPVSDKKYEYRVFRQKYFGEDYWDNCFYGCYWEPQKELYTMGEGKLSSNGKVNFDVNVDFSSDFNDYKYIVEVTVKYDGDESNTTSNSIIAKLQDSLKTYNPSLGVSFLVKSRFIKAGEKFRITGGVKGKKWKDSYNNNYIFIVKRKEFLNKKVTDSNGFERNIVKQNEVLENIFFVNDKNFSVNKDGMLELDYSVVKNGEYVFEYGPLNKSLIAKYLKVEDPNKLSNQQIQGVFDKFEKDQNITLSYEEKDLTCSEYVEKEYDAEKYTNGEISFDKLDRIIGEGKYKKCVTQKVSTYVLNDFGLNSLINNSKYFTIISYSPKSTASNPILDDNKLIVSSDKVSYKIGETAKILVRLPVSKSNILLNIEKDGIKTTEFIPVEGNIFFKEILVDESFIPNAYISVFMMDLENPLPEYKVGYGEIVVDKTDKKADIEIKTNEDIYSPRSEVSIDLTLKDSKGKPLFGELTVMVVDDSLISLMGNINPNTLEFIYKKLPFSIQTAMSNIAMLRNYYFSRSGQVGGSGDTNLKGGDSAVSTRNTFKNTAFFGTVISDENGKAKINFELPDDITTFRIIALANTKNNFFGYSEKNIEVKKPIVIQNKTPILLRQGDNSEIGAIISNNSSKDVDLKVSFETSVGKLSNNEQNISLKKGENHYVSANISLDNIDNDEIKYSISAIGESADFSDKIEKTIEIRENPILITNYQKFGIFDKNTPLEMNFDIPENTDLKNSKVVLTFANNKITGIENILQTLNKKRDFYNSDDFVSIIEENLILKKFSKVLDNFYDKEKSENNLEEAINQILSYQNPDGGFSYFEGWNSSYYLTNIVVRNLMNYGNINPLILEKSYTYLENIYSDKETNDNTKAEIYFILKKAGKNPEINFDYTKINRYAFINFTYGLLQDKSKNSDIINSNVELIKKSFVEKIDRKNFYQWDNYLEKSLFTSLLFDLNNKKYIPDAENYVLELYEQDWTNNYFSNETRNSALRAFLLYLENNYKNNYASFGFQVGTHGERGYKHLGSSIPILKFEYKLSDILEGNNLKLKSLAQTDSPIYVTLSLKQYPKNKTKVREYSNGITLQKEIFEVIDQDKLLECKDTPQDNKCRNNLKKVDGDKFYKGKTYKTRIVVKSENPDIRNQIILSDYLAGTMQVVNSKFLNVSSNLKGIDNWDWQKVQRNANLIQAITYTSNKELVFEYYFTVGYNGEFNFPPTIIKELYNPDRNANSDYKFMKVGE